jgi:hypothetical protein
MSLMHLQTTPMTSSSSTQFDPRRALSPALPERSAGSMVSSPSAPPIPPVLAHDERCIRLDMESLACFERVTRQFEAWGAVFTNAIAINPSNPAFPVRTGKTVLTGAPHSSWLGIQFHDPVTYVGGFVTSSRPITLSAYNAADQLVAKVELPSSNLLLNPESRYLPNLLLSVQGHLITRVVFHAFNGQFTLDELVYSTAAGRPHPAEPRAELPAATS